MRDFDFDSPFGFDPDELATDTGDLLLRCAHLYKRHQRAALRGRGLTPTQDRLLFALRLIRKGHALRATELASTLRLHPVLVARLLRLFETRGWIGRRPDPKDKRAQLIELTAAGLAKAHEERTPEIAALQRFFDPLQREERGFERLLKLLLTAHDPARESSRSIRERHEAARKQRLKVRAKVT